jgi:CubicO group peptidase (beta-lactamase class C family)
LVLIVAGAITSFPASAQTPSALSFTLPGGSLVSCWFYGVSFSATEGQKLTLQWSENPSASGPVSLDFYIVPLASIQRVWLCEEGPVSLYWNDGAYGTANWAAPSTGGYVVLLVNYSYHSVSATISVTGVNATISTTPIGPNPVRRETCLSPGCIGT